MVGLAEVFTDLKLDMVELALSFNELDRVMNSLLSWEDRHTQCGWGFVETRRPCKGYPRRPFWRRIRSNPMRRNYH